MKVYESLQQSAILHSIASVAFPVQSGAPFIGGGSEHDRLRSCIPFPQEREHSDHIDQGLQLAGSEN